MRNIIILLIGICFLQFSCKKQNDSKSDFSINAKNRTTKKIDRKRILMFLSFYGHRYIANDTLFVLEESNNMYIEMIKPLHNNIEKHIVYGKKNLELKSEGCFFTEMPIGIHKFYDDNGHFIKKINYDEGYKFTLDNLIVKVKKEFQIDLKKKLKGISIRRGYSFFYFSNYIITILDSANSAWRVIVVDGTYGFIFSDRRYVGKED